ncbi:hypothetical protein ATANTOWER_011305 [Ataeniobius toweri]|uniref:Fusion protein IQCJ-SCHIP1 N-terminal domain-containing protein n=1 Tax=Ataeniobius toweri TaxID=208326 RepID=A0ABU7AEY6_9TELE|nr:hypothetical protein [Ataeniobius toweri]
MQDQLKSLQSGCKHVNNEALQLQSNHLTMDMENNININLPPMETKVLIIQRAWRDFLQRQEVEKRSPSPPSLYSSDKMSMSISMMTLSDGSTPGQGEAGAYLQESRQEVGYSMDRSPMCHHTQIQNE